MNYYTKYYWMTLVTVFLSGITNSFGKTVDKVDKKYAQEGIVKQPQVRLNVLLDKINLPTVIKTAIIPGDREESIFITTQPGELWLIREGTATKVLDISFKNGGEVLELGSPDSPYDERGLLGLEFHPEFTKNGRFFLYYSTEDHTPKLSTRGVVKALDPCDAQDGDYNRKQEHVVKWTDENKYDHVNVVEEWKFVTLSKLEKTRRLLSIKHPFSNHNSIDNLFWSSELDKLLVLTGDGGFRDGPFNLSQDNNYFQGKVIALAVESPALKRYDAKPITRFEELPKTVSRAVTLVVKGVRNWSGMCEYVTDTNSRIKFFGQPGQESVEAVFAFNEYFRKDQSGKKQPLNMGWRPWEGSFPLMHNRSCKTGDFTLKNSALKNVVYYQEAIDTAVERRLPYCEYYHQDKRPDKVQGVSITGQQVYTGTALKGLKDHLIISDWGHNNGTAFTEGGPGQPISPGFLIAVPIESTNLDRLHEYKKIEIVHDFKKPAFFVSLGANTKQNRLFLGVYQTTGTRHAQLGTVFEIIS